VASTSAQGSQGGASPINESEGGVESEEARKKGQADARTSFGWQTKIPYPEKEGEKKKVLGVQVIGHTFTKEQARKEKRGQPIWIWARQYHQLASEGKGRERQLP